MVFPAGNRLQASTGYYRLLQVTVPYRAGEGGRVLGAGALSPFLALKAWRVA